MSIRETNGIGPRSVFQVEHGKKGLYAACIADRVAKLGSLVKTFSKGLCSDFSLVSIRTGGFGKAKIYKGPCWSLPHCSE